MKIVIADACLLIDVYELELTGLLFALNHEFHISLDVFQGMSYDQKVFLGLFDQSGDLRIHNLIGRDRVAFCSGNFPPSLSHNDRSSLFLVSKMEALLLSSDKVVRDFAKPSAIPYHGLLWVIEELIIAKRITVESAVEKISSLIAKNLVYQNNYRLRQEMNGRIKLWRR